MKTNTEHAPASFNKTWMSRPLPMNNGQKGTLCYATYQPLTCGCCVTGDGSLQFPLTVQQCPMHAAAPALLDSLKELTDWAAQMGGWESPAWERARAAVAQAEGGAK